MIKVYVRGGSIENGNGQTITTQTSTVRAARKGNVTVGLRKMLREAGMGAALGEEIVIEIKD